MNHSKKIIALLLLVSMLLTMGMVSALADGEAPADSGTEQAAAELSEPEATPPPPAEEEEEPEAAPLPEIGQELPVAQNEAPVTEDPAEVSPVEEAPETPAPEEPEEADDEPEEPAAREWVTPGNTDAEILGGGRSLTAASGVYFSDGGIWLEAGGTTLITAEEGMNLNLSGGWLYYTVDPGQVRRVPASGGSAETVLSFGAHIKQLYVMGAELRFVSGGAVYSYDMDTGATETLEAPDGVTGLIPTAYGNLYLTGSVLDYTLWAGTELLRSGVEQCYTDDGWLVVVLGGETMQTEIAPLFEGVFAPEAYTLHAGENAGSGLSNEAQLEKEAAYLASDTYELMQDALSVKTDGTTYYTEKNSNIAYTAYTSSSLTEDQKNMVLRSRQMAEVLWTPLQWRYSWGGDNSTYTSNNRGGTVTSVTGKTTIGYFEGGQTYKGIPYSQAVSTGYVGWNLTIDEFIKAVNDTSSPFYSGYSKYSRTAPYYGSDCSGFVSWAWNLPYRCTCTSMLPFGTRITNSLQNLRIGDSLNNPNAHVVIITDIGYDADGNVVAVEITEQTPSRMRVTCYGELFPGKEYENKASLSYITSYYFNGGYSIYRRNYSGSVSFTESAAVTLNETGYAPAPLISLGVNAAGTAKVVTLVHTKTKAPIYYTLDGSEPTAKSTRYTGPFELTKNTTVRAMADCGEPYTGSYILTYNVSVQKAQTPYLSVVSGAADGTAVASGTKIKLVNDAGNMVHYTTDGSAPTKSSAKMPEGGIEITGAVTIKAIAVSDVDLTSDAATVALTIGAFYEIEVKDGLTGGSISPAGKVSVKSGSNKTFEIKAGEYYEIEDVLVDGKSVGAVPSYTFENVSAAHTITAKFAVALPFKDVNSSQWFADSVGFVYSKGLFSGTSATTFSPSDRMTRGMFITVMGRLVGGGKWTDLEKWSGCLGITNGTMISIRSNTTTSDESIVYTLTGSAGEHIHVLAMVPNGVDGSTWYRVQRGSVEGYMREKMTGANGKTLLYVYSGKFSDIPNGAYYTGYAQWAHIYGLMNGTSDTSFSPNSSITRQDICVIFYRYLKNYSGKTLSTSAGTFTDDSSISSYAKDAVYAMKNIGVISGYTDGTFRPKGYATRAEVATMFERLYSYLNG